MDIRAMQASLQGLSSMIMRMMSQDRYIKKSSESWLERSLKQYAEREAMEGRLGIEKTKRDLLMEYVKNLREDVEGLDRSTLAMTPQAKEAGLEGYIEGVDFPQQTAQREEVIAPTRDSIRGTIRQFFPDNPEILEALTNLMMTKGSDESLTQMADFTKITEAEKERKLEVEAQKLTGRGLDLRGREITHKEAGTEKVDKTIAKINTLRKERLTLMNKISVDTVEEFFGNAKQSDKNFIKAILSKNRDIKRLKSKIPGYEDSDQIYADVAEEIKEMGGTKEILMEILLKGDELAEGDQAIRDKFMATLNKNGLSLPILMEYF